MLIGMQKNTNSQRMCLARGNQIWRKMGVCTFAFTRHKKERQNTLDEGMDRAEWQELMDQSSCCQWKWTSYNCRSTQNIKCECGTVMDSYTRHMKLQGLRKNGFSHGFIFVFFLIAHRTFTPGKQRYDRKEGNKSKSMPRGSPCLIAQRCHRIFLWVRHKHTSRVGGEKSGMKAQNERKW